MAKNNGYLEPICKSLPNGINSNHAYQEITTQADSWNLHVYQDRIAQSTGENALAGRSGM